MWIYLERIEDSTWINDGSFKVFIPDQIVRQMKPLSNANISQPLRSYIKDDKLRMAFSITLDHEVFTSDTECQMFKQFLLTKTRNSKMSRMVMIGIRKERKEQE